MEINVTQEQVIQWIHSTEKFGSVLGLSSIRELMRRLGNPQKKLQIIHVAGTNGKGSVCAMLASILTAQGYRTGLYTSPYIEEFQERISIDNEMIPPASLAELGEVVKRACEKMSADGLPHPTEFELVTAVGFLYFAQKQCDFVVLEVGLGGRLDATNVIDPPLLSIVTMIDYDHMERLGNTLQKIAYEKCGILKEGSCVVSSPDQPEEARQVIQETAEKLEIPLYFASQPEKITANLKETGFFWNQKKFAVPLLGNYQAINVATVLEAVRQLRHRGVTISPNAVLTGLAAVRHKARMELIRPNLLIDGGHNLSGVKALCDFIHQIRNGRNILIVAGMLKDKDYRSCGALLRKEATVLIATQTDSPRRLEAAKFAKEIGADFCQDDPIQATELALSMAKPQDLAVVCGSFTLVGPVRSKFILK